VSNNNLESYYKTNFSLAQHHKWDIQSIENLIIFEKDIYVDMLINYIKEREEANKGR
jgi:hypothetical protein